jgi:hypothetical protein
VNFSNYLVSTLRRLLKKNPKLLAAKEEVEEETFIEDEVM